jgi:hypothetical protein
VQDDECDQTNSKKEKLDAIELPDGMWDRISKKAFELWQERGYRDGHDLEDWLDAEAVCNGNNS